MILTLPGNLKSSADAAQHRCAAANSVLAFLRSDSSGVARQCQAGINSGTLQVGNAVRRHKLGDAGHRAPLQADGHEGSCK